jgi:hypothetical protein
MLKNNKHETQHGKNRYIRISKYLSIIILNVNRLNFLIKSIDCLLGSKSKIEQSVFCKKHTLYQRHTQTKSKSLVKNIYQACKNWKQVGVAILISEKADFKQKSVRRDFKKNHYILIKETIQQEEQILNIYAPNIGVPKLIKQTLCA